MTGNEYMNTICPTTSKGKDPNREDVSDAFEDGIAEGWKQCKEKHWKPTERQLESLEMAAKYYASGAISKDYTGKDLYEIWEHLKKL